METLVQALPEVVPTVSFDIRLGRQLKYIDFDYEKCTAELRAQGINEADIASTAIDFAAKILPIGLTAGQYHRSTKAIEVNIWRWSQRKRINTSLIHEAQHRIADCKNDRAPRWLNTIANTGIYGGVTISSIGTTSALVAQSVGSRETIPAFGITAASGAGMMVVGMLAYLGFNAEERHARRVARRNKTLWLNIER